MHSTEVLEQGRRAFDRRDWSAAYARLSEADRAGAIVAGDLERLATAAYLAGHDQASTELWARAFHGRIDHGETALAVRCAFWLGFGLLQRGETAQCGGWLARAGRLVEQHSLDGAERGYLLLPEALMAMDGGDHDGALVRFREAAGLAERFGDRDLAALGSIGQGEVLVRSGQPVVGMRWLDQAMVSVTAGETSPVVSGIVYCAVIELCYQAFDLERASEWTAALDRWCAGQPGLVSYRGQCLVHRAQILRARGQWDHALREALLACDRLADPPHPAIGMAYYELAELHRLQGRHPEADAAYRQAHTWGRDPQPGLALLRFAEGRVGAAASAIERAVEGATDMVSRARLLPAYVDIMLAAERVPDARRAADALDELARTLGTAMVRATSKQAHGAVLLAEGDLRAATEPLEAAVTAWRRIDARYEEARARLLLADACHALGDEDAGGLEAGVARVILEHLGAPLPAPRGRPPHAVTARELEVLRLVASGATNRDIAERLAISERTVERHLHNIFTKVGAPNRAAATAYAFRHGMV
jgi:DNA-binding CsgD family transcriptional regulator